MTKAPDILKAALGHMQDRAATYDKPEGERSIPNVVAAFNAMTGHSLTAEQGWLFLLLLKAGRTQQGGYRADNYEDGAAYFALMGEQAVGDRVARAGAGQRDWVNYFGDPMTVKGLSGARVELLHRDGSFSEVVADPTASYWDWLCEAPKPTDIVSYRCID